MSKISELNEMADAVVYYKKQKEHDCEEYEHIAGQLRSKIMKLYDAQSPWDSETEEESAKDATDIMNLIEDINGEIRFLTYTVQNQVNEIVSLRAKVDIYGDYIKEVEKKLQDI